MSDPITILRARGIVRPDASITVIDASDVGGLLDLALAAKLRDGTVERPVNAPAQRIVDRIILPTGDVWYVALPEEAV